MKTGVLGGSVISRIGLMDHERDFVQYIYIFNPNLKKEFTISKGGLTYSQALTELAKLGKLDMLILYFGTSVAWPVPSRRIAEFFRKDLLAPGNFHIPPKRSSKFFRRLKSSIRRKLFMMIKFILYPLGLYSPKTSYEDLPDLVKATANLAMEKATNVIWIQHKSIGFMRLWYERRIHEKYFNEIITILEPFKNKSFRIIYPKSKFMIKENFLLDCIHLSEAGHRNMAREVTAEIKRIQSKS